MYFNNQDIDVKTLGWSPWDNFTMSFEESKREHERWRNLTYEQQQKEWKIFRAKVEKERIEREATKKKALEERSEKSAEWLYINAEKPHSLDGGEAFVTWLVIMLVGAIFHARWFIWLFATTVYVCYLNRHAIRKRKWDNGDKEQYYKNAKGVRK